MDDKSGGGLFLCGVVVVKNWFVRFLKFDVWQRGCLSGQIFVPTVFQESGFYLNSCIYARICNVGFEVGIDPAKKKNKQHSTRLARTTSQCYILGYLAGDK
jgi:hypothetical protein